MKARAATDHTNSKNDNKKEHGKILDNESLFKNTVLNPTQGPSEDGHI